MQQDKNVPKNISKNSANSLTAAQVRDLIQTLVKLREQEIARQEKRQTGKHAEDGIIKVLGKTIGILKKLLQYGYKPERYGYKPERYGYSEEDFSYGGRRHTLTDAQKENLLSSLDPARMSKAKNNSQSRTNHDKSPIVGDPS